MNTIIDIGKLHTTHMGEERVRNNLGLQTPDIVAWCKQVVSSANDDAIVRKGKNWYVFHEDFTLTINAHSHTIITAHKTRSKNL
ncbi:hypothetical protein FACS1894132_11300 [Clostridia bacterium]|nr:hypothetical protein FACS1894132_11300 [Clostridia bacterium]